MYEDDAFIAMRYKPTNFAFSGFNAPFLSYTKEEFFPFIDKYGQFKHKDWTDKIKSDGDYKKRAEEEKAFYEKIGRISGRDQVPRARKGREKLRGDRQVPRRENSTVGGG